MFNSFTFNAWYFNNIVPTAVIEVVDGQVVYNGQVLHRTDSLCLTFFGWVNWPVVELQNYNLPNTLGVGNNSSFTRENSFQVTWYIRAESWEDLNIKKDELKALLSEQNKFLQVNFWGNIRRAKAYVTGMENIFSEEHYNITFVPFQITFNILEWYWEDVALSNYSYPNLTTTLIEEILNNSTFLETRPVINVVFNAVSSTDTFTFSVWDTEITINTTFGVNDVLIIDSDTRDVTLNGSSIDFDWVFPILWKGNNSFTASSNGTYDITLWVAFRKTFI